MAEDWQHNVHADYQTHHFRSLDYLRRRVAGETGIHILAALLGFDLVDQTVDVSALTGCGGWEGVFTGEELSPFGLLADLERANAVQEALRAGFPGEHHAQCDVWAIWRLTARPRRRGAVRAS